MNWRFNTILLKDKKFLIAIKMKIKEYININLGFSSYHSILKTFKITFKSWILEICHKIRKCQKQLKFEVLTKLTLKKLEHQKSHSKKVYVDLLKLKALMNNIAVKRANYFYRANKFLHDNSNKTGKWLTALIKGKEKSQHNSNLYKTRGDYVQ